MDVEHRHAVRALDQLHRCRPARVDLDGNRHALPRDEVDSVETDETELAGCDVSKAGGGLDQLVITIELRITSGGEHAAAVAKPRRAEGRLADELAREAKRRCLAMCRDEDD